MRGRILAVAAAAALTFAAPAKAAVIQDFSDVASATNGIVLGPDGNFWVVEEFNDSRRADDADRGDSAPLQRR